MIPSTLHFVWVGPKELPEEYARNITGWKDLHPGWRVRLWNDETRPQLINEDEFRAARNPAQAADILRYELLDLYGGIYLDCDIEPLRALDALLPLDAFAVDQGNGLLCTAAIGAHARHRAFRAVVAALPEAFWNGRTNLDQTGPDFQTPILRAHGVTELPQETFYPYLWSEEPKPPTPETLGIHRWAKSWVPAAWRV